MSDLAKKIQDLAARGELTHLSICAVAGNGPSGIVYSASFTPATVGGSGFGRNADPVKAIEEALKDDRLVKLHRKLSKPTSVPVTKRREPEPWEL